MGSAFSQQRPTSLNTEAIQGYSVSENIPIADQVLAFNSGNSTYEPDDVAREDTNLFTWIKTNISGEGLTIGGDTSINGKLTIQTSSDYDTGLVLKDSSGNNMFEIRNSTLSDYNLLFGISCGEDLTTGVNNFFAGTFAGRNVTSGSGLVLIGRSAGEALTDTTNAVIIGNQAAQQSTSAFSCFYLGTQTGWKSNGSDNTIVGNSAFYTTNTASRNVGLCTFSLYSVSSIENTGHSMVGYSSGGFLSTAKFCSGVGYNALIHQTQGDYASSLGANAGPPSGSGSWTNFTCIGANSTVSGSNQVQLGDASTTTYAYGAVQDRSDMRDKIDIQDIDIGMSCIDFLSLLEPKMYRVNYRQSYMDKKTKLEPNGMEVSYTEFNQSEYDNATRAGSRTHIGVIAQDIEYVLNTTGLDIALYQDHKINGGEDVYTVGYQEFIGLLIQSVKELKQEVDALKETINE